MQKNKNKREDTQRKKFFFFVVEQLRSGCFCWDIHFPFYHIFNWGKNIMKGRRKGGWKRGKKRENINKGKNYEKI